MAGAMRKAMVYLGLVEEDDRYDYEQYDDYEGDGEADGYDASGRGGTHRTAGATALREERHGAVATMPDRRPSAQARPFDRITTIHPRTYNEAKTIGESFRDGTPVIMNLSDMGDADAKRLVDFAAGLVFGLHGTIERVTSKVFLLSPVHIEVATEEVEAAPTTRGFFNQS